jgi:hypothetical protein
MKKILAILAVMAASFVGGVTQAHATTFGCTGGYATPNRGSGNGTYYLLAQSTSGITCSGGTGTGWVIRTTPQYKSSTGAWHDGQWPGGAAAFFNLPNGNDDCAQTDHYANNSTHYIFVLWDWSAVCIDGSDQAQDGADAVFSSDGYNFTQNGFCGNSVQGWRIKYYGQDQGNPTGNNEIDYSGTMNC